MVTLFSPPNPTTAAADASDAELLRAFARSRDELAFGRLVARHAAAVRRIALRQTGNPFAAEDVAQATYLVLSGRLGPAARSAARRGSVRPWLARTCRYCAANWRRGERRRRRRERVAAVPERVDPSRPGELAEAVVAAMGRLGGRDRKLIELHHLDEQPWPQVAAELKLTPEAAKRAGARAMERLRDALSRRGITASAGALLAAVAALVRPARANALPSAAAYEVAKGTLLMLKLQTVAVTVAALAVVAGLTGSLAVALQGDGGAASPSAAVAAQPAAPATKPAPRVPLVVKFADNAVWNLVALGDGASSWRPDGTPTDEPRLNLPGLAQGKVGDATLPPAEDGRRWLAVLLAPEDKPVGDRVNVAAADTADEPGIEAPRVADSPERVVLVNVPADAALKLVLTAPVTAWAKIDATTPGMSASATFGLGGWTYFGQPAELDGNATVSVFFSDPTGESRVLAVDKAKKPHAGRPAVAETPKGRDAGDDVRGSAAGGRGPVRRAAAERGDGERDRRRRAGGEGRGQGRGRPHRCRPDDRAGGRGEAARPSGGSADNLRHGAVCGRPDVPAGGRRDDH